VRSWGMNREESILYAYRHEIPITATKEKVYSIDDNIWGRAHRVRRDGGPVETCRPRRCGCSRSHRDGAGSTSWVGFGRWGAGEPGTVMPLSGPGGGRALNELSRLVRGGGASTWWRTVASASRAGRPYEARRGLALYPGPTATSSGIVPRTDLQREKARPRAALRGAHLRPGWWFSPLKQALDAFIVESQRYVTGEVRLRLEPGVPRHRPAQRPSLYDYGLATYDAATASATRTPRASCALGASASRRGPGRPRLGTGRGTATVHGRSRAARRQLLASR
jgi:argininosuccinate synthase